MIFIKYIRILCKRENRKEKYMMLPDSGQRATPEELQLIDISVSLLHSGETSPSVRRT